MRIYILILVSFLLLLGIANAGRFYTLDSFREKPEQTFLLQEKDALLFDFKQGRHALIFEKFNTKGGIDIGMYIYQISYNNSKLNQSGIFFSLKPGMYSYLDFDRDLVDDMQIKYLRQIKNNATLSFIALNKSDIGIMHPKFEDKYALQNESIEPSNDKKYDTGMIGLVIAVSIIAVGLLLLFFMNKKHSSHS